MERVYGRMRNSRLDRRIGKELGRTPRQRLARTSGHARGHSRKTKSFVVLRFTRRCPAGFYSM
jgi:hypothetical protein